MLKQLTLKNRIFLISSALVITAFALIWVLVRPQYREAIINERTTIVSQLQEYSLLRADRSIRNWLNNTDFLANEMRADPGSTESLARRAINYTPGLIRISLNEQGAEESVDFTRSIYEELIFPQEVPEWYESKLNPLINISWIPDTTQNTAFFIAQRTIQIESFDDSGNQIEIILLLTMYFDATRLTTELTDIPLGGKYETNIISEFGEHIVPNQSISFPDELVGNASYSKNSVVTLNGKNWFILSSRFESIPFWHLIAVQDTYILQPVRNLIMFSVISGGGILLLMIIFSFYVSARVNKPIDFLLQDVEHLSNLDFDHRFREVDLPEFSVMQQTLEHIRITLHRYQKINVEKIILEEWKNRYMMTYSEDLIGILDNEGRFRFANNHFVEFIEAFGKNPKEVTLDELLNSKKIELSKSGQNVHYPNPYTIRIDKAELAHFEDEETTYFYDFQHVNFKNEQGDSQGSLVILHDKTKDRLVDIKRTDMINIIVHELKNPITGVVGLSKLMMDNDETTEEEQQELLKEIYLSGERMNDLVNRFLDVQRLEFGRIPVEFKPVDLFQIINEVKSVSGVILNQKNLKINISAKGTSFIVSGSRDLLFDATQNLVSNAVKYGDSNRTIEIELEENEDDIRLSVTDHGFGISVEDQNKVFDKFFRVRSNIKAAKEKGTGLGLAYVKEIMHKHHGDIQLESNDEIGSRFTMIFPNQDPSATE